MNTSVAELKPPQIRPALTRCRICRSPKIKFRIELETWLADGIPRRFFLCGDCSTLMDEIGLPVAYGENSSECSQPSFIQYQLQSGCCLHFNAVSALLAKAALGNKFTARSQFLDVGSGLGFSLAFAKKLGFEVMGIEPSAAAQIAQSLFGVPAQPQYLEKMDLPEKTFDLIHSSEVIEHVYDPVEFVQSLARALKETGVLFLTTPNAEAALHGEKGEKEWLECYVPGHHMNILSPQSARSVLNAAGFRDIHILTSEGTSGKKRLLIAAALRPGVLGKLPPLIHAQKEGRLLANGLLETIVRKEKPGQYQGWLYEGALFRLFEENIHQAAYERAKEISQMLDERLETQGIQQAQWHAMNFSSFEDYIGRMPAFAGLYSYLKGILALNGTKDYAAALRRFMRAENLFRIESQLLYYKSSRWEWLEKARFHQGLALLYNGKRLEALALFDALLNECGPTLSGDLKNRLYAHKGIAHLQKRDNFQALTLFAKQLLREPWPLSKSGETLKHVWQSIQQGVHDRG